MRFSLFGIPTEVQFTFWIGCVLLGLPYLQSDFKPLILIWAAVVFVSILVHELGHALAIRRHGLHPEITLHWIGGLTSWSGGANLSRPQRIFISFAGPLAGFLFAGVIYGAVRALPDLVGPARNPAELARNHAVDMLLWVNVGWGAVNLLPVLPLDGGHILEHALGPRRARATATVSLVCAGAVAAWGFAHSSSWIGFLFAMCALHSWQRYQAAAPPTPRPARVALSEPPVAPEVDREIRRAREALHDDRYSEALALAQQALERQPPATGRIAALEVLAWANLLAERLDESERWIRAIERHGRADAALTAALLFAKNDYQGARAVCEAARASGDDRKEIVGPLIQILIAQDQVPRAAAIALDVIDSLSDEDARQMSGIAFDQGAFGWAARLFEALFDRTRAAEDAYFAARSQALGGDPTASLALIERAVAAGFRDAARLWSDEAMAVLRQARPDELAALLPKPSP